MMRLRCAIALLAMGLARAPARGAAAPQGGRDVSVALFTTHAVRSVVLTPVAAGAWTSACAVCVHRPLVAPLTVSGEEVLAGGSLRVADAADASVRATAAGLWHVRGGAGVLDVVLTLPSERYTAAVVSAEGAAGEPAESLRALAIMARTYALNGPHYTAGVGHLAADLCDSTQCQALRLEAVSAAVEDAVRATAGETLWFGPERAEVFFSQHCGGVTADAVEAWGSRGSARPAPYLRSHPDPYCLRRGPAAWNASVSLEDLAAIAHREGWRLPERIAAVRVARRTASGRMDRLAVVGASGDSSPLSASALRFAVGRALGWDRIRSDLYVVAVRNGSLVFDGRGHGHGVGLCQAGAAEMAAEHRDARAILAFYFPGTRVRIGANDEGWAETRIGAVRVRNVTAVSPATRDAIALGWQEALQRFPVRGTPEPVVLFAPSTEMYRQMTGQPGWDLASTRGNVVTLQPDSVLRIPRGRSEVSLLRHELLHVLIESEARDRAPLWLREGLAEHLSADNPGAPTSHQSGAAVDSMLQHASSLREADMAHRLAGARVRALIERYGFSTVRGWLRTGAPATVAAGN